MEGRKRIKKIRREKHCRNCLNLQIKVFLSLMMTIKKRMINCIVSIAKELATTELYAGNCILN